MDTRKQKLDADLDALEEELKNTPVSVRLEIHEHLPFKYTLMGGLRIKPKYLYFKELPTFLQERLALLQMIDNYQEIPTLGKKYEGDTYHLYISPAVWETLAVSAGVVKEAHDF